jgi:hypothetical protein
MVVADLEVERRRQLIELGMAKQDELGAAGR